MDVLAEVVGMVVEIAFDFLMEILQKIPKVIRIGLFLTITLFFLSVILGVLILGYMISTDNQLAGLILMLFGAVLLLLFVMKFTGEIHDGNYFSKLFIFISCYIFILKRFDPQCNYSQTT